MNRAERIERLRGAEQTCYRICRYLLQAEAPAHEAAKLALLRLYRHEGFLAAGPEEAAGCVRDEAVRACLALGRSQTGGRGQDAIA